MTVHFFFTVLALPCRLDDILVQQLPNLPDAMGLRQLFQ